MNTTPFLIGLSLCLTVGAHCAAAQSWNAQKEQAAVQAVVRDIVQRQRAPSATVSIAIDGTIVFAQGFSADGQQLAPETLYRIGSVSKQFTAAGILSLVEAAPRIRYDNSTFTLDSNVVQFFEGVDHWNAGAPMTVRRLLNMNSNIPSYTDSAQPPEAQLLRQINPTLPAPYKPLLAAFKQYRLSGPQGSFHYSNTNYFLLALIIEGLTSTETKYRDYRAYLREHIFLPAGMHNTDFISTTRGLTIPGSLRRPAIMNEGDWPKGAGEIVSNVIDMAQWNTALFSGRVLAKGSLSEMLRPAVQIPPQPGQAGPRWPPSFYAMGWVVRDFPAVTEYSHDGSISGYTSRNVVTKSKQGDHFVSVTILTNTDEMNLENVTTLLGELAWAP